MAARKAATRRVFLRLDEDAADLLDQLAPSENKRGAYVSGLLRQAALAKGLPITASLPPAALDLAALQQQVQGLQGALASLDARLSAALAAHSEPAPALAPEGGEL